jgi:hypothetical protein
VGAVTLDYAMAAAERGWSVFPVKGKVPTVKWADEATRDPHTIAAWLAGTALNYGIACGPSGLLVIDEDTPGGFDRFAADHGVTVPATYTVATGRGRHLYFNANGHALGNAKHALAGYGVDVRGRGGYVVGPGSTHATGATYTVTSDVQPAPVPSWLHEALTAPQQPTSGALGDPFQRGGLGAVPEVIPHGQRDEVLFRYASSLCGRNVPVNEAEVLLKSVWQRCQQPPECPEPHTWPQALATLRSVYDRYPVADTTIAHEDGTDPLLGRVLRRSELANLPPLTPLVEGLLDYPSAAVLVGSYGIGKTFLVLALACCVATGRPWLGQPVERRKVLLVVGEGGSGLDKRIAAWEQGYNRGEPVGDDDLVVMVQPQSLSKPEVWQRIAERCAAEGTGFVILDTFSSLAPDADETKDAATALAHMHRIAAGINGSVLLVHHPGWGDADRSRGGSQFESNADFVLLLKGTPDEPVVQLRRKKVKDDENGQVFWMRRETYALHGDHLGETSVLLRSINPGEVGVPMVERIKVVLDGYGDVGATGPQIKAELGGDAIAGSTFYKALRRAEDDGLVGQRGNGNARRFYLRRKE